MINPSSNYSTADMAKIMSSTKVHLEFRTTSIDTLID